MSSCPALIVTACVSIIAQKVHQFKNLQQGTLKQKLDYNINEYQHIQIATYLVSFLFLSGSERCGGKKVRVFLLLLPFLPLFTGIKRVSRRWK